MAQHVLGGLFSKPSGFRGFGSVEDLMDASVAVRDWLRPGVVAGDVPVVPGVDSFFEGLGQVVDFDFTDDFLLSGDFDVLCRLRSVWDGVVSGRAVVGVFLLGLFLLWVPFNLVVLASVPQWPSFWVLVVLSVVLGFVMFRWFGVCRVRAAGAVAVFRGLVVARVGEVSGAGRGDWSGFWGGYGDWLAGLGVSGVRSELFAYKPWMNLVLFRVRGFSQVDQVLWLSGFSSWYDSFVEYVLGVLKGERDDFLRAALLADYCELMGVLPVSSDFPDGFLLTGFEG